MVSLQNRIQTDAISHGLSGESCGGTFHRPIAQGCAAAVHRLDGRVLSDPHRSPSPWVWGSPGRSSGVGLEATAFEVSSLDDSDPVHGSDGCAG